MNLRLLLPFLGLLATSSILAQNDVIMDVEAPAEEAHDPKEPFTMVEEMPEFPGGQQALFAYIGKELKYPEQAVEDGIEGVVFVTFVVEKDGSISTVSVLRGIGGGCDEEAVRVVRSMPKWKPGKQLGKEVRVKYNLPIHYKLTEPRKN